MSTAPTLAAPDDPGAELICPDQGHGLPASRVGNRRSSCKTCNAFARRLERAVGAELRADDPDRYQRIKSKMERKLYADLLKGQNP